MKNNNRKQNKQYQVFILKNDEYLEISYEEFCKTQDTIFKDAFFISSNGVLMEVSQEFYKEYYYDKNHSEYLDRLEAEHTISFHNLDDDEFCGEEILIDPDEDVAEQVTRKLMGEYVRGIVATLPKAERELIEALYFHGMTEREYSQVSGIPQTTICYRKNGILKKLKKLIKI